MMIPMKRVQTQLYAKELRKLREHTRNSLKKIEGILLVSILAGSWFLQTYITNINKALCFSWHRAQAKYRARQKVSTFEKQA